MSFATRADLLARGSANRIAQLASPTDKQMLPLDAVRAVLGGDNPLAYPPEQQPVLVLMLDTVDKALADADALILSYGIPETVQTTLLARMASTIALYYLQGAERMTDGVQKAYEAQVAMLKAHAKGDIALVPATPTDPVLSNDLAVIESSARRYGRTFTPEDW